jgi:hypothetical protein
MSLSSSSSSGWWDSRFTCRLRGFSRLLLLVLFVAVAMTFTARLAASSQLRYITADTAKGRHETLLRLNAARNLFFWDHYTRAGVASYYAALRPYDERHAAIAAIEEELRYDPYSAALWMAVISFKLADLDEAGAQEAFKQLAKFRRGMKLEKED